MSVKSLSIAEGSNTMVIEPMAHWWKRLHLQYYDPGVSGNFPRKIASGAQRNRPALHLVCVWSGIRFFRSLLVLQKDRCLQTMKIWKWGPKTHLQLLLIVIGATKDNEMKMIMIITLSIDPSTPDFDQKTENWKCTAPQLENTSLCCYVQFLSVNISFWTVTFLSSFFCKIILILILTVCCGCCCSKPEWLFRDNEVSPALLHHQRCN